jgi:RNA polymerase sigma-70 factor (ECF subfamily)
MIMTGQYSATTSHLPEPELIGRILKGEKSLFEIIIRRYNQQLYRIGMSVLDNEAEVEDAMQGAYTKAYEHLSQFQNRSRFSTWLTRIMLNGCFEQKRKNKLLRASRQQPVNYTNMRTPANELMNKELSGVLEQSIGKLPEKYRMVFVMREIEEMSVRDTAESLDIGEANVKVRFNRAKALLRESLNGYLKDHVYSFHLSKCDKMVAKVLMGIDNL